MADTADLVVLGAFYGQGSKGKSLGLAYADAVKPSQAHSPLTPRDGKGVWFITLLFGKLWHVL